MPKLNKSNAASHVAIPGYTDMYSGEIGDWEVSFDSNFTDMDEAPLYKGGKDDLCQSRHVGFMLKGKFGIRKPDGSEEFFEAGDAFVIEPGHTPLMFEGSEFVSFTPLADAREQTAVVMPNMVAFAKENGVELPKELLAMMPSSS